MITPFAIERPAPPARNPRARGDPGYRYGPVRAANDVDRAKPGCAVDRAADVAESEPTRTAGTGRVARAPYDLDGPVAKLVAAAAALVGSVAYLDAIARIAAAYG
jgi:hypothetical protein